MKKSGKAASLLAVMLLLFAVISCGSASPELQQVYWQLNVKDDVDMDRVYEVLSLWVNARDEDGHDDLEYIYLIHDDAELMWELSSEQWTTAGQQGEEWIGSNGFVRADLTDFPRGEYRIVVIDTAGERDEGNIYVSMKQNITEKAKLPFASAENGELTISNAPNGYTVWGYNEAGEFIGSIKDLSAPLPLQELEERVPGLREMYIYSYDMEEGYGLLSGPYEYIP